MKILVIVPAYNEEEAILHTVKDIRKQNSDVDILVVNDASKDRTREILQINGADYIDVPINLGIGGGVQVGYIYAFENGYDIAVQMDGDGQHPADQLTKVLQPLVENRADLVIGSRFISRDGFQSSVMRRTGIKFLSFLIHICTRVKVLDVTSGYRAVNRKFIKIFGREYAQDFPEPEALVLAAKKNARIVEVPVIMKERQGGVSSISRLKSVYYMIKVSLAILIRNFSEE